MSEHGSVTTAGPRETAGRCYAGAMLPLFFIRTVFIAPAGCLGYLNTGNTYCIFLPYGGKDLFASTSLSSEE